MFALKRTSLGSVLDCVALCLEEGLLSLAKRRLEEVWKSFTEHTKRVDVWLKNDSEKGSVILLRGFHIRLLDFLLLSSPRELLPDCLEQHYLGTLGGKPRQP